ncbi:MAG: class D beta-lactamase [Elainella sp.]
MSRFLIGTAIVLICTFGGSQLGSTQNSPSSPEVSQQPSGQPAEQTAPQNGFGPIFQELGLNGSIVIYDKQTARFYEHNPDRNSTPVFPASTFKIFNALAGLETGVVANDVAVLTWDGIRRGLPGVGEIAAWNQDTNLRQAFKNSTIWFYQVIARKVGPERMQNFLSQSGYGNQQIGTPDRIDKFWLEGPLQITPKAQIAFLQKLEANDLPFSQRPIDLVKDMMILEQTPGYTLRGKTGWDVSVTPNLGWLVGYLEQNSNTYFFATHIEMPTPADASQRVEVTRRCLRALGLL